MNCTLRYPPRTRGRAVVMERLAAYPLGGMTWGVLRFPAGKRSVGFDVWYVRDSNRLVSVYNWKPNRRDVAWSGDTWRWIKHTAFEPWRDLPVRAALPLELPVGANDSADHCRSPGRHAGGRLLQPSPGRRRSFRLQRPSRGRRCGRSDRFRPGSTSGSRVRYRQHSFRDSDGRSRDVRNEGIAVNTRSCIAPARPASRGSFQCDDREASK